MSATMTRAEPSPYEELLIATALESGFGQETLLEAIERLNQERQGLQAKLAEYPSSDRQAAQRLHAIEAELSRLWAEIRRLRAARRVELEEALGVGASFQEEISCPVPNHCSKAPPLRKVS